MRLDHQLCPSCVADERRLPGVVHGVGQIADEYHVEAQLYELPDSEGASQHAHVRVSSRQCDVLDAVRLTEAVDLVAAITDAVEVDDVDSRVLPVEDAHSGTDDRIVARLFRDIDRQFRLARRVEVAPPFERCRWLEGWKEKVSGIFNVTC